MRIYQLAAYHKDAGRGLIEYGCWSFPFPGEAKEAPRDSAKEVAFAVNTFLRKARNEGICLHSFELTSCEMDRSYYYSNTITYDPDWHDRSAA